jgi:hypothetical protein
MVTDIKTLGNLNLQGLVIVTKILRSEKFAEKLRKILHLPFLSERSENYLADVLA